MIQCGWVAMTEEDFQEKCERDEYVTIYPSEAEAMADNPYCLEFNMVYYDDNPFEDFDICLN
jgi:hypothetical protein|tara:strand:- start:1463 stop:1648 length:186 start_codon:yes stop_codon:yes gene_type:complete